DLTRYPNCFVDRNWTAANPLRQCLARNQFHDEKRPGTVSLDAVNRRNVRVIERSHRSLARPSQRDGFERYESPVLAGVVAGSVSKISFQFPIFCTRFGSAVQEFEITVTGNPRGSEIVLDYEDRHCRILWNNNWPGHTRHDKNHVIALRTDAGEAFSFEHLDQLFVGNRTKLWHVPAKQEESLAAH